MIVIWIAIHSLNGQCHSKNARAQNESNGEIHFDFFVNLIESVNCPATNDFLRESLALFIQNNLDVKFDKHQEMK